MPEERGRRPMKGEPVLERAFRILDVFTEEEPALTLTEISQRSGIPLSSSLRLAKQLVSMGALERRPDGNFTMGLKMFSYAALAPRSMGLRTVAMSHMELLRRVTKLHVQLIAIDGEEVALIERLLSPDAGDVAFGIGSRAPLHRSASGLVLLAFAAEDLRESYFAKPLMEDPGSTAITDPVKLRREIADIRAHGRAWFSRAYPEPSGSVAAPVFDHTGACIAALSVVGMTEILNAGAATLEATVITLAKSLSREVARARITSRD